MPLSTKLVRAAVVLALLAGGAAMAQPLTIYEIQSNTSDGDASVYHLQVVDCVGGVVIANLYRTVPRLVLQDPNYPDGWAGIQVKDRYNTGAFDEVEVGDWVSLTNVEVEEFRGTTFLQWYEDNNPTLTVASHNNPLPRPIAVSLDDIPAPVYDPNDGGWYVEDHQAEPYESMRLGVWDVTVTGLGYGKESDNYRLRNDPDDPNAPSCWAADYLNADRNPWDDYHRFVTDGRHFCRVSGILEQYTNLYDGWDYYQLLTLATADLGLCGDLDHDGDVDLGDLGMLLANYGVSGGADYEDGDLNGDGSVTLADLGILLGVYGTTWP